MRPTLSEPMDNSLHQAPLSMGFSRQEYWSGLPFPSLDQYLQGFVENLSTHFLSLFLSVLYFCDAKVIGLVFSIQVSDSSLLIYR